MIEAFSKLYDPKKTNIISIGNTTSDYIKNCGYLPLITSKMQSYEGISGGAIISIGALISSGLINCKKELKRILRNLVQGSNLTL